MLSSRRRAGKRAIRTEPAVDDLDAKLQYQYEPLGDEPYTTRLLCLLPDLDRKASIRCRLVHHTVQPKSKQAAPYDALSYAWGDAKLTRRIYIGELWLRITESLHEALVHLRDRSLERYLWTDAVCINQYDDQEKEKQILFMRDIYTQSQCVVVWLGPERDDSDLAITQIFDACWNKDFKTRHGFFYPNSLVALFRRSWFQRIWVLQEIAAAHSLKIVCGQSDIDGYTFCRGVESIFDRLGQHESPVTQDLAELNGRVQAITSLIRLSALQARGKRKTKFSLGELLDMFRFREATRNHDKIYALLGMSRDGLRNEALRPDYSKPWAEVLKTLFTVLTGERCSTQISVSEEHLSMNCPVSILGYVHDVELNRSWEEGQRLLIRLNYSSTLPKEQSQIQSTQCTLNSGISVDKGDTICLLAGATTPMLIRVTADHNEIVATTVKWPESMHRLSKAASNAKSLAELGYRVYDLKLIWLWKALPNFDRPSFEIPDIVIEGADTITVSGPSPEKEEHALMITKEIKHLQRSVNLLQDLGHWQDARARMVPLMTCYEAAQKFTYDQSQFKLETSQNHLEDPSTLINGDPNEFEALLISAFVPDRKAHERDPSSLMRSRAPSERPTGLTDTVQALKDAFEEVTSMEVLRLKQRSMRYGLLDNVYEESQMAPHYLLKWAADARYWHFVDRLLHDDAYAESYEAKKIRHDGLISAARDSNIPILELFLIQNRYEGWDLFARTLRGALDNGKRKAVERLIEEVYGFNDSIDVIPRIMRHVAAYGHLDLVDAMIKVRSSIPQSPIVSALNGALGEAAANGHLPIMERLLEAGADVNAKSLEDAGSTALQAAARGGHLAVVNCLIAANAQVDPTESQTSLEGQEERSGLTHYSMMHQTLEEEMEPYLNTPLKEAAVRGHFLVVEKLILAGADINHIDETRGTALHLAVGAGHIDTVEILLQNGALVPEWTIRSAEENGHLVVAEMLRPHLSNNSLPPAWSSMPTNKWHSEPEMIFD